MSLLLPRDLSPHVYAPPYIQRKEAMKHHVIEDFVKEAKRRKEKVT